MALFSIDKPEFLECGERARLLPVVAETSKEERITSCFLAAVMSVDEFAKALLATIGVRLGKTSRVECFTQIVLKRKDKTTPKIRPDGLIVITTGNKQWKALVESKAGKSELQPEQIETYLELAREHKIDAVLTLSNQCSSLPTHHPVTVNKNKLRSVSLYHWSWTFLVAEAVMWVKHLGVADKDQRYILEELVRYMQHESAGVLPFDRMNSSWKDVCSAVQSRIALKKTSPEVQDSVGSWHQFVRNASLHLSLVLGTNVTIYLKRNQKDKPSVRLEEDADQLTKDKILVTEFEVPDAAGRIKFVADLETRAISVSMRLKAPDERATSKGRINWVVNQLRKTTDDRIAIRAIWPGRASDTLQPLRMLRLDGADVLAETSPSLKPIAFEIILTQDLGTRFKGAKTFVQDAEPLLPAFYEEVGQYMKEWVAPPPKVKRTSPEELMEEPAIADD